MTNLRALLFITSCGSALNIFLLLLGYSSSMRSKQEIRERIWKLMENKNLVSFPRPCFGRIPNFIGSAQAGEKILALNEFKRASGVFCAPDAVLRRVRELVLEAGKVLVVATPHMKKFLEISEVKKDKISKASTIKGFELFGKTLQTKVDLFIQGAVALDLKGSRLGKGSGYGDKEYWWLKNNNLLDDQAKVVVVAHELQILDDFSKLMTKHDVKADYILTPERIVRIK